MTEVLLHDESFTYMLHSLDRKNKTPFVNGEPIYYDFDFGGFTEHYDDYICEVISFAFSENILGFTRTSVLVCENLAVNGYFLKNIFSKKNCIITIIGHNVLADGRIQTKLSGGISFRVNNCRVKKEVKFFWLNTDLSLAPSGTNLNLNNGETKWFLTFKMTPIKKMVNINQ